MRIRHLSLVAGIALVLVTLAFLAGCRHSVSELPGVKYVHLTEAMPWSIHVVTCDLARKDLAVLATVGVGVQGSETVPDMVARLPRSAGQPIAAVNGDYFEFLTEPRYRGTLEGTCMVGGELVGTPAFPTFWIDKARCPHLATVQSQLGITWPDGSTTPFGLNCSTSDYKSEVRSADVVLFTPAFGPSTFTRESREFVLEPVKKMPWLPLRPDAVYQARVREVRTVGNTPIPRDGMVVSIARKVDATVPAVRVGDLLTIATRCAPVMTGVRAAVSGAPLLLVAGQLVPNLDNTQRHPRTAVGFAGTRVVFVVVDGRQPGLSVGMSHRELAELMLRLGCTDALNLDGGGSSTLWYNGKVVNSPSGGVLRPVGNALVLVRTATH